MKKLIFFGLIILVLLNAFFPKILEKMVERPSIETHDYRAEMEPGKWVYDDHGDDHRTHGPEHYATLKSDQPIQDDFLPGQGHIFIVVENYNQTDGIRLDCDRCDFSPRQQIPFSFDSLPPLTLNNNISGDPSTVRFSDGQPLISLLKKSERVVLEARYYNDSQWDTIVHYVSFRTKGLIWNDQP